MAKFRRFKLKKVPKVVHLGTLKKFKEFYNVTNKELERIITQGPATDPSVEKIRREFEAAVFDDFNKYFTSGNMATLSPKMKDNPLAQLYNKLQAIKDPTTMKTPAQAEGVQELSETLQDEPAYKVVTPQPEQTGAQETSVLRPPAEVIGEQVTGLGKSLIPKLQEALANKEKSEVKAAKTKEEKEAIKQKYARQKEIASVVGQTGGQLVGMGAEAYQRGAPPIAPFGTPGQSELLNKYDALINMMRPERTGFQKTLAALSPYGTQAGSALGQAIGQLSGGPLGQAIGGTAGSLLGLGAQELAKRYGQPEPEFAKLGRFLSGTRPGFFSGGKRGLAGLIAGEDPRSTLQIGYDLLRGRPGRGRTGRLRSALGGGVRRLGEFIGSPGQAQQLRNILQIGQGLYDVGEELGINPIKSLGRKLGLVGPEQQMTMPQPGGYNIAAAALPSALEFIVPTLQRQAEQFYGHPVPPQDIVQGLDEQLLAAAGPQIVAQNIRESELAGKRQALNLKKAGVKVDRATQQALNKLKKQQQQQKFQRTAQRQDLAERENLERAKMQAKRGRLSAVEAASGQQVIMQQPLERATRQPGLPEGLDIAAQQLQQATTPFVQHTISEALRKPVKLGAAK